VFTTRSDDYRALVGGPNGKREIRSGQAVHVDTAGFYTLLVFDRQLRRVQATITGSPATTVPPSYSEEDDEIVSISIEARI
jgi:hypothetical protein